MHAWAVEKWHFKPENCVQKKREDRSVRLSHFYSKGANVKIAIALVNTMLLS